MKHQFKSLILLSALLVTGPLAQANGFTALTMMDVDTALVAVAGEKDTGGSEISLFKFNLNTKEVKRIALKQSLGKEMVVAAISKDQSIILVQQNLLQHFPEVKIGSLDKVGSYIEIGTLNCQSFDAIKFSKKNLSLSCERLNPAGGYKEEALSLGLPFQFETAKDLKLPQISADTKTWSVVLGGEPPLADKIEVKEKAKGQTLSLSLDEFIAKAK